MESARVRVEVVYCPSAFEAERVELDLPRGSTLMQALQRSRVLELHPELDWDHVRCGIFGRVEPLQRVLRDGDRVELYRPLQVDPKEARRLRAQRQREASDLSRSPKR